MKACPEGGAKGTKHDFTNQQMQIGRKERQYANDSLRRAFAGRPAPARSSASRGQTAESQPMQRTSASCRRHVSCCPFFHHYSEKHHEALPRTCHRGNQRTAERMRHDLRQRSHGVPRLAAGLQDKTYVFAPAKNQENSLEYSNYEQLIRTELQRLGFSEQPQSARLKVSFSYGVQNDTVVITQPAYDPFWYGPPGYPGWRRMGGYPFYDPFWYGPPQQTAFPVYNRQLHLSIANRADGRKLYEVRVDSDGRQAGLAAAMPYMVRSAFADFRDRAVWCVKSV